MKKLASLAMALILLLSISIPTYATEQQPVNSLIYQEKGQIILDSVELSSTNGKIKVLDNLNSLEAQELAKLEDPDIQQILTQYIEEGKTPAAIGWTKVYLKESTDPNKVGQLEPMTLSDIITPNAISGPPTNYNNLTLYTLVGYDNYDPSFLFADSVATWQSYYPPGANAPSLGDDDFISITWPNGYFLNSSTLLGGYSSYKHDSSYDSVVYGFREQNGTHRLGTNGWNVSNPGPPRKWISTYVHTWGPTVPSFSFGPGSISVSLSNPTISWKIASDVIY